MMVRRGRDRDARPGRVPGTRWGGRAMAVTPVCPQSAKGVIECLKIITRAKSQRIAKFAFDYATKKGRGKVTAVHKANIM